MLHKKWLSVSILASAAFCSVASADDGVNAVVGAAVGALIGNSVNGHNGAVVGGVLGAVVGASASGYNQGYYNGGYAAAPGYSTYYQPAQSYYEPAPVYYQPAPVYAPPVNLITYQSGRRYYGADHANYFQPRRTEGPRATYYQDHATAAGYDRSGGHRGDGHSYRDGNR